MNKSKLKKFIKDINKLYWENNCLEEASIKWEEMFDYLDEELKKCNTEEELKEYCHNFYSVERDIADEVVYNITDYLKRKYYKKEFGL